MSTPEHREVAGILLEKARADLSAARTLAATANQDDHIIGFHLQQAVEKALKTSGWLTPWGVLFRYDDPAVALDRDRALEAATSAVAWAEAGGEVG